MEFDQRKNVKPKRCETAIPRRDMEWPAFTNNLVRQSIPYTRLEFRKDIITHTIGRKSVLDQYHKK
jgi:hypothetical protein